MKQVEEIHAHGPQEHTLCGYGFDAQASGDKETPIVYAGSRKPNGSAFRHDAPLNPEFLGAAPAKAGEDY